MAASGIGFAAAAGLCLASRVPAREIAWSLRPFAAIALISLAAQMLCAPAGDLLFALGPFTITDTALLAAAMMLLRLLDISAASIGIMHLVGTGQLIACIERLLQPLTRRGVRTQGFTLALQVALQAVPQLAQRIRTQLGSTSPTTWRTELPRSIAEAYRQA